MLADYYSIIDLLSLFGYAIYITIGLLVSFGIGYYLGAKTAKMLKRDE